MLPVYTYSPEEVDFILCGYKLQGWSSIAVSRAAPVFTKVTGIRGKSTRVRNKDTSATIFIDLVRTSPANTILSEIVRLDSIHGTGRLELLIKDKQGGSLYSSVEAFIEGYPDDAFTTEINNRRWVVNCLSTSDWNVAGNEQAQDSLFNRLSSSISNIAGDFL